MSPLGKLLAVILEWPKTTVFLALALVGGGFCVSQRLSVDVFPDIKVPRVTIQTEAGGLTAEEGTTWHYRGDHRMRKKQESYVILRFILPTSRDRNRGPFNYPERSAARIIGESASGVVYGAGTVSFTSGRAGSYDSTQSPSNANLSVRSC